MSALILIVHFLFSVLVGACLLRCWSNYVQLGMQNQPGPFIMALTDLLVMPIRKSLLRNVRLRHLDLASLMVAIGLAWAYSALVHGVFLSHAGGGTVLVAAMRFLLETGLNTVFYCVLAHAVLSWVQPYSQTYGWLERLISPLLGPIRQVIPRIGGVDVSGVVLLLVLQVLLMWVA